MPVYLALSRLKYGTDEACLMRSRLSSTQFLNASGVSVTALALSADGCLPSRMRLVSRAISSSVLRIVTARQRQCGCQPVNLKSFGYRPASVSQMSVSVRTALALGVPSARICPGKSEVFSPGWRRMVWLLLSTISMPTTKSIFCQRRWSAVRYAILVSVAARRRAFIYELRYTPRHGWKSLAAWESLSNPCSSRTRRNSLSGCRKYWRRSRVMVAALLPERMPRSSPISISFSQKLVLTSQYQKRLSAYVCFLFECVCFANFLYGSKENPKAIIQGT